ncbi:MAG: glucans biosynthesis glucosyltransferase MdoH [Burkholderiales bacterium]|nr:MAG: glucans biosynthesis glucosyltransferase MdoH [Burkholderiales bacterium]
MSPMPESNMQAYESLPVGTPIDMPVQSLRTGQLDRRILPSAPPSMFLRRLYLLGGTATLTALATYQMWRVLRVDGLEVLEVVLLALFAALFAWIAQSFLGAVAGFVLLLSRRRGPLGIDPHAPLPTLSVRTALLMPTYNEDPHRLMSGLQAIYESVRETGRLDNFEFFILSDTTRADIAAEEISEFHALRARLGGASNLHYRRRSDNRERKAGNIAEWVLRFGGGYPFMLILDADSLMTGDTIVRLAGAIERHDDVGLIQSLPAIVNGSSLFARMQQFSGRVYGPVIAHGVAWWHGAESNYWGHNAIIRTQAFAAQAGLPELPGKKPFGGHVLSHDFVEAALMRRGGWALHMVPNLRGSYEEGPPSLTDLLVRDRRWCQGNLQHAAVLPARGLHWVSRWHFSIGIGHYFTAPMWAMLMLVGIAIPLEHSGLSFSSGSEALSPVAYWKSLDPERILWLFAASMGALFAPKILGYLALLTDTAERRACGGALRVLVGILIESVLAALMAPIVMYVQSRGVAEVLAGKDSGWEPQRRDDGSLPFSALVKSYGGLTLFGLFIGVLAAMASPALAAWMAPVILGMVLAVPLVALTSARRPGQWLRRRKLLAIPEEIEPPAILTRATALRAQVPDR